MEFGQWIRTIRREQKLEIRTVAIRTGVEASTISRVENARTQVTLGTAIRICEGLGVTITDLLRVVQGKQLVLPENASCTKEKAIPTLDDVEAFLLSYRANAHAGYVQLSTLLQQVLSEREMDLAMSKRDGWSPFAPEGVRSLLFHSAVYHFEIQYPPDIEPKDIVTIYTRGGVITLVDIGMYVRKIRHEKQVTLAQLEETANVSINVLLRLEAGALEQVKLAALLRLDDQLEQDGTLLALYWRVHQLNTLLLHVSNTTRRQEEISSSSNADLEAKLLSAYITLHRWLLHVPDASCRTA